MTKCSWKYGVIFLLSAFWIVSFSSICAADTKKDILGGKILSTEEKTRLDKEITDLEKEEASLRQTMERVCNEYNEAYDEAQGFLALNDFFFNDWIVVQLRNLSPVHDNSWDTYMSHYKEKLQDSLMEGDTEQAKKWNNVIKKAEECLDATNAWHDPATALTDKKSIRDHGENVLVYYDEKTDTQAYYVINDDGSYESVAGVTKGCMPIQAKIAEGKNCIFCPLFAQIFSAAQNMATSSFGVLAQSLANVMLVGFALWVAFSLLGKVSSFTKMDAPKYITELLTQAFKVLFAYLMLRDANAVYAYVLGPLLKAGIEFGMTLLSSGDNLYLKNCESMSGVRNMSTNGLLPYYLYTQLDCFIRAIQFELSVPQAIGSSLMCVSRNAAAIDMGALTTVTTFRFPDLSMAFEGIIIWVFAWLLSLAFAFYLVDATVRLGIVGALMPFLIVSWPFKVTSKYTNQGFTMFMNTFFTYVFMGLVVSVNIQLLSESMAGVPGGKDAIIQALNGNKVSVLKDLLDIGFSGFLILIASCIFGFKLTGQATELAGSMAGGGGGSSIAPQIGGMGYNVAKEATLGVGKMAWSGTKLVGNATGVTPKLRQAKDKVVSKVSSGLRNLFTFGRATSQSRTPVSRVRSSEAGASTSSSAPNPSSGGTSPVTPDQARQAEQVENATPRTTTPQTQTNQQSQTNKQSQTAANTGKQKQDASGGTTASQTTDTGNSSGTAAHGTAQQNHEDIRKDALKDFEKTAVASAINAAVAQQEGHLAEIKQKISSLRNQRNGSAENIRFYQNVAADPQSSSELKENSLQAAKEARQEFHRLNEEQKKAEAELQQIKASIDSLNQLKKESSNQYADSKVDPTKDVAYNEQEVLSKVDQMMGKA